MNTEVESCRVGDVGVARTTLMPSGEVEVAGETYCARSRGRSINAGDPIIVIDSDVGGLVVQSRSSRIQPESIPDYGSVAYASSGDHAKAVGRQEEEERQAELAAWKRLASWRQKQLGIVFGFVAVGVLHWNGVLVSMNSELLCFCLAFGFSIIAFCMLDTTIRDFDDEYVRLVTPATCMSLIGATIGLSTAGAFGLLGGVSLAAGGAIVGGVLVPTLGCLLLGGE